jgi:hypothetical protein
MTVEIMSQTVEDENFNVDAYIKQIEIDLAKQNLIPNPSLNKQSSPLKTKDNIQNSDQNKFKSNFTTKLSPIIKAKHKISYLKNDANTNNRNSSSRNRNSISRFEIDNRPQKSNNLRSSVRRNLDRPHNHASSSAKRVKFLPKSNSLTFNSLSNQSHSNKSSTTVCHLYLSGTCTRDSKTCNLLHTLDKKYMPHCFHFLNYLCAKGVNCPYLHVNLGKDVDNCQNFM